MALQVGPFCYADAQAAGSASCARFEPVTSVTDSAVRTVTCEGSNSDGSLNLRAVSAPPDGSASAVVATVVQPMAYAECTQGDVVQAVTTIGVAIAVVWVIWWGYSRVSKVLEWGRGEQ